MKFKTIKSKMSSKHLSFYMFISLLFFALACTDTSEDLNSFDNELYVVSDYVGEFVVISNECLTSTSYIFDVSKDLKDDSNKKVIISNLLNTQNNEFSAELLTNGQLIIPKQFVRMKAKVMVISGSVRKTKFGLEIDYQLLDQDVSTTCSVGSLSVI